ncbi:MAG: 8-oxo-dGTP pyrophosphatase MutT (NUDIX family) [Parasphingorhabdus sp.]
MPQSGFVQQSNVTESQLQGHNPPISRLQQIAALYVRKHFMPTSITAQNGRQFSCFPAAILVIVVNDLNEVLLFSKKPSEWIVVSGAIEEGETILESAIRELKEEAGEGLRVLPVGVVHAHTFQYDEIAKNMISIHYVVRYQGGEISPGDDMAGAIYAWWSLLKIQTSIHEIVIPKNQYWIFERAINLISNFEDQEASLEYDI